MPVSDAAVELQGAVGDLARELTNVLFPTTKSAAELNSIFKCANVNSFPHRLAGRTHITEKPLKLSKIFFS